MLMFPFYYIIFLKLYQKEGGMSQGLLHTLKIITEELKEQQITPAHSEISLTFGVISSDSDLHMTV